MSWRDTIRDAEPAASKSSWRDTITTPISKTESFARGAAQGATGGFADEITATAKGVWSDVKDVWNNGFSDPEKAAQIERDEFGRVVGNPGGEAFDKALPEERAAYEAAEQANPGWYGTGAVGGAIATSALTPLKSAGLAGNIAQGTVTGAGMGNADNIQDMAADAAMGGVAGGVGYGVIKGAGAAATKAGNYLSKLGNQVDDASGRMMYDALSPTDSVTEGVERYASKETVGKILRDDGVGANPFRSNKGIANRISGKADDINSQIIASHAQADTLISKSDVLADFDARMAEAVKAGKFKVAKQLAKEAKDFRDMAPDQLDASVLRNIRKDIDDGINFASKKSSQKAAKEARSIMRDQEFKALGDLAGENEALFKEYSATSFAREAADKAAKRSGRNSLLGLNARTAGVMGGVGADPVTGVGMAAASEFLKRYGQQLGSVGLKGVSKLLKSPKFGPQLQEAAKRGGNAVAATHFLLMQSNPEYRQMIGEEDD